MLGHSKRSSYIRTQSMRQLVELKHSIPDGYIMEHSRLDNYNRTQYI